jgi:hypothetical protein
MVWLLPEWGLMLWLCFLLAAFAFWLFILLDIIKSNFIKSGDKQTWVLMMILVPVLGAILYFLFGRKKKIKL